MTERPHLPDQLALMQDNDELWRVGVLLPLPVEGPFDYSFSNQIIEASIDANAAQLPGKWVEVPFGPRHLRGVIWRLGHDPDDASALPPEKLKPVAKLLEAPPLSAQTRRFVDWVANYTLFPAGSVLRMVMRNGDALTPPKGTPAVRLAQTLPDNLRRTPQRDAVLTALENTERSNTGPPSAVPLRQLADNTGTSTAVIRGLIKAGALTESMIDPDTPFMEPDFRLTGKSLSSSQAEAVGHITRRIDRNEQGPVLIDGVTGAGKTEVYLDVIAHCLARDPTAQILIMLPEIGLTLPFLTRVEERFGAAPAGWHSDVAQAERRRVWRRVLDGQARLVVGARSALFLPWKNLQLIIVDEEHDAAYKQEDGVLYHGRDMAVARGQLDKIPVLLASATPALETVINAAAGRYDKVTLTSRFGDAQLPSISLIDLKDQPPEKLDNTPGTPPVWLSPPLVEAISQNLVNAEQSLLFLNRRGYAPLTICRKCGHRMTAPHSDTCLVEHRFDNRLVCHHTGYSIPKPKACPNCNVVDGLAACGPGVERIADEARARWPHARLEILSSDRTQNAGSLKSLLEEMRDGAIDILVATQAAAKGHNFPGLTLVGIVDGDMGLAGGDLRAAERTYQLLNQVAGRAGRFDKPGRALIQTHRPDAPVLKALVDGDRDKFLAIEAEGRIQMTFPPFGRMAAIILRGKNEAQIRGIAKALADTAPCVEGFEVWGPAPAPIYRLNGEVRMRLLVRARRELNLQAYLRDWQSRIKIPSAVRRIIDIDPYSFM